MSAHLFSRQLLALFCVIVLSACDGSSTVVVSSANNIIGNADTVENPINNDASNGGGDGTSDTNSSLNIDTNADDGDGNNGGASGDSSAGNPIADDDSTTNLESNANPGSTDQTGSSNLTPVNDPAGELEPEPATEPEPEPEPVIDPLTLGSFELRLDATRFELIEANENGVTVPINISRIDGHVRPVRITVSPDSELDSRRLDVQFDNNELERDETFTSWRAELGVAMGPLVFHERTFTVTAEDGRDQFSETFTLDVRPISAPDVYLLIGQSNMEGSSELGARDTSPGGADELNPRIRQLNVRQNDRNLFNESILFIDEGFNAMEPRFITAEDPLHEPRFPFRGDKEGSFIGLGLSFAKRMLPNTSTDIILVPAAWSGRGFCGNDDSPLSWNAADSDEPALGGTLLTDRAITRLNMTLRDTGGIFRGMLWHQGEADSNTPVCATRYENNVIQMANRIRSEAFEDARGLGARGENAPVPFILGTMTRGADERGDFSQYSDVKQRVDNAHRNLPNVLPFTDIAFGDDLVPQAFPCGQTSCIHFGAAGYRELGNRYSDALQRVFDRNP